MSENSNANNVKPAPYMEEFYQESSKKILVNPTSYFMSHNQTHSLGLEPSLIVTHTTVCEEPVSCDSDLPQITTPTPATMLPVQTYHKDSTQEFTGWNNLVKSRLDAATALEKRAAAAVSEECYSRIYSWNGQLWVLGKAGRAKVFLSADIRANYLINPGEEFRQEAYWLLQFSSSDKFLRISMADYNNDRELKGQILRTAQVQPSINLSRSRFCNLLRGYIEQTCISIKIPYYYGWQEVDNSWQYSLYQGTTHAPKLPETPLQIQSPELFTSVSPSTALTGAQQIAELFRCFSQPAVRRVLFVWFHLCFLHTPLLKMDFPIPIGLYIRSTSTQAHDCMSAIFNWYHDKAISMCEERKRFLQLMQQRKDQPLMITDHVRGATNRKILLEALANMSIPSDRSGNTSPLQALPTVLCGETSVLRDPAFLTMNLDTDALDKELLPNLFHLIEYRKDYFQGFAAYASRNFSQLEQLLREESLLQSSDWENEDISLSITHVRSLHIFRAVQRFVQQYLESLIPTPDLSREMKLLFADVTRDILELLKFSVRTGADECDRFLFVAAQMLDDGAIRKVDCSFPVASEYLREDSPIVYIKGSYYGFNNAAFNLILSMCPLKSTDMKAALKESNLLEGVREGSTTYKAQMIVQDTNRKNHRLLVYRLLRSHFEDDPENHCPFATE